MENIHKYFSSLYKYYRNIVIKYIIHIGMIGFRFAFFLSRQSFVQTIYRFLFVKRPRDLNDILIEPEGTQQWLCSSQINSIAPSSKKSIFRFKKSSLPSKQSFDLKEEYHFPPFSHRENTNFVENSHLFTYSIRMTIDNTEKKYRIIKHQLLTENEYENLIPKNSSVSFLDIQYHHPEMKESIILEVPKEWCCVGNQLFSPTFVLRMLYYQTLPFVFDMRYTLEIMDNDLNILSLNSKQTMVLKDTGYDVL